MASEQLASQPLRLFQGFGIELEYMLVDDETLDVKPIADLLLRDASGGSEWVSDVDFDGASWSNELVSHVIEFKTNGPAPALTGLSGMFQGEVRRANGLLKAHNARLMPGGMHPWMRGEQETKLWTHDYNEVYETFNRIFDARGDGWSNLQSTHINLPFGDDAEFGRLHAAIRLVLPILPAIAASSPVRGAQLTGLMDNRLDVYRLNAASIPSISGHVIPEQCFTRADYEREILEPIYRDLATHDPDGVLRFEFSNARGAIARFMRDAIEIRVLDIQECPAADIGLAALVVGAVRALVERKHVDDAEQRRWPVEALAPMFLDALRKGGSATIADPAYPRLWGVPHRSGMTMQELWQAIAACSEPCDADANAAQRVLLERGCLSARLIAKLGASPDRAAIAREYRTLAECLAEGRCYGA